MNILSDLLLINYNRFFFAFVSFLLSSHSLNLINNSFFLCFKSGAVVFCQWSRDIAVGDPLPAVAARGLYGLSAKSHQFFQNLVAPLRGGHPERLILDRQVVPKALKKTGYTNT